MKKTLAIAAAVMAASPAIAEDLSVVGSWSSLPLHNQFEAPFWTETLPAASGGEINVALTTHNQMNLGVGDVYRARPGVVSRRPSGVTRRRARELAKWPRSRRRARRTASSGSASRAV